MVRKSVGIKCLGIGSRDEPVLAEPISVNIAITRRPASNSIAVWPQDCPHNTGGHGQRCKASHPGQDKVGDGIFCPYSFDHPHVLSHKRDWQVPEALSEAFKEVQNAEEAA